MTDKPDPMELVRDLEKFATNPSERLLAKELGSLLFDHSTLKVENAKLKQDLHHYMLAANAEAELVDELQKENRTLVRQNGKWQAKAETDEAVLRQALAALESADWYINQLEQIVYCVDDTGTHEERAKVQSAITAIKERLG
jgi:hypothetical protein